MRILLATAYVALSDQRSACYSLCNCVKATPCLLQLILLSLNSTLLTTAYVNRASILKILTLVLRGRLTSTHSIYCLLPENYVSPVQIYVHSDSLAIVYDTHYSIYKQWWVSCTFNHTWYPLTQSSLKAVYCPHFVGLSNWRVGLTPHR